MPWGCSSVGLERYPVTIEVRGFDPHQPRISQEKKVFMADTDIRRLERDAAASPSDIGTLSKLVNARARIGEEIDIYWKIRHKDGNFCSGMSLLPRDNYSRRHYFTSVGKTWRDKTELYKFIKKAAEGKNEQLNKLLKGSEVIEYRTIEFEKTELEAMFEQAELEILRAEKIDLEKKLAEKEKLLAQKEKAR